MITSKRNINNNKKNKFTAIFFALILIVPVIFSSLIIVSFEPSNNAIADDSIDAAIKAELDKMKAEAVERQTKLQGELKGVNEGIANLILEIDDLQNTKIAIVQVQLSAANKKLKECQDKSAAIQRRLDVAQKEKEQIQGMLDEATGQFVGAKIAMGSLAREEIRSSLDQLRATLILDSENSSQFVSTIQSNEVLEQISARIMHKAGEKQVVYQSKAQRLEAVNQKIEEIKKEADENQRQAESAQAEVQKQMNELQGLKKQLVSKQRELESKRGDLASRIERTDAEIENIDLNMQLLAMGVFGQLQPSIGGFVPGYIISDGKFYTHGTMTAQEIQSFLNIWGAKCNGSECFKNKRVYSINGSNDAQCHGSSPGREMSMAEAIVEVSATCNISEKVLLVTIQKEQGLISRESPPEAWRYKSMLGYGCPDGGSCDPGYAAPYYQLYAAAWQFQKYRNANSMFRFHPGQNNYLPYSPKGECGGKDSVIANSATAGLYIYTPYTPNDAALSAGFGLGDGCSSYGNRNFYLYYKGWFGSPL